MGTRTVPYAVATTFALIAGGLAVLGGGASTAATVSTHDGHRPAGPAVAAHADKLPAGFQDQTVLDGLTEPTTVAFAPGGAVFVAEKAGVIRAFDSINDPTPTVFADLNVNVANYFDRGLLGLAIDPEFTQGRPYVYVTYAYDHVRGSNAPAPRWGQPGVAYDDCPDPPGGLDKGCVVSARITRLTAVRNGAGWVQSGGERELTDNYCLQFPSHAAGSVHFGPDGYLYASAGEGASYDYVDYGQTGNPCGDPAREGGALRAQDVVTTGDPVGLDGAIIRIDPDTGAAAPGNPITNQGPEGKKILAYGLRNPFRFTFRPGTSELYVGDVGETRFEEINRVPKAAKAAKALNFGWPCAEGVGHQPGWQAAGLPICRTVYARGYAKPLLQYKHGAHVVAGDDCPSGTGSVSGLAFMTRSTRVPAQFRGALAWSDYSRACIWVMLPKADGTPDPTKVRLLAHTDARIVDLVAGRDGSLYYVDIGEGTVHRISYGSGGGDRNRAPVAKVSADKTSDPGRLSTTFHTTGSYDPDGDPLSYAWDLDGDGTFTDATGPTVATSYNGDYNIRVRVRISDPKGASSTAAIWVSPNNTPPVITAATPANGLLWRVGQRIGFSATATDAEDGDLEAYQYDWSLEIRHCPSVCHTHPLQQYADTRAGSFVTPDHEYPSHLLLRLSVTDTRGTTTTRTIRLNPRAARLVVRSNRPKARYVVAGVRHVGGSTTRHILGTRITVSARKRLVRNGHVWVFARWSDGGRRSHVVRLDHASQRLRVVYRKVR